MRREELYISNGPDYHWRWWISRSEYRRWVGRVLSEFPADGNGATILDIGCGDGVESSQLAARGYTVIGLEYLEAPLGVAMEKVPEVTFVRDFPAEPVDYVLITDALFELKEDPAIVNAVQTCHQYAVVTADPANFSGYAIERLFSKCTVETVFEDSSHLLFIIEPRR